MAADLFPKKLIIKQRNVGSCYLLVFLDCLFYAGDEGLAVLSSLFQETKDGITVRLKSTKKTPNIDKAQRSGKYFVQCNPIKSEYIFYISREQLDLLEQSPGGVESNSIAVTALEHIVPYFFIEQWSPPPLAKRHLRRSDSTSAHDAENIRCDGTETNFLGQLLNIPVLDINDIDFIIKMKAIFPQEPVYVSIIWHRAIPPQTRHDYHALRIDNVVQSSPALNGSTFDLINPWDNQSIKRVTYDELLKKDPHFSILNINPHRFAVIKYLKDHPIMLNTILQIKVLNPDFDILAVMNPLKDSPIALSATILQCARKEAESAFTQFADRLRKIPLSYEHIESIVDIQTAHQSATAKIEKMVKEDPHYNMALSILTLTPENPPASIKEVIKEARLNNDKRAEEHRAKIVAVNKVIMEGVEHIHNFNLSFSACSSERDIDSQSMKLHRQLDETIMLFLRKNGMPEVIKCRTMDKAMRTRHDSIKIRTVIEKEKLKERRIQVEMFLEETGFNKLLTSIGVEAHALETLAERFDLRSLPQAIAARKLATTLTEAQNEFTYSRLDKVAAAKHFQTTCRMAINLAQPILSKVSEWDRILEKSNSFFDQIQTAFSQNPISSKRYGFFQPQPNVPEKKQIPAMLSLAPTPPIRQHYG